MTTPPSNCPDCGTALPADSPQHLCPSCLLKQAFASRTVAEPSTAPTPPPSPEEIADKFPQFEVTECLGRGGMGVVYKARQKSLNRWVAIKILAPEKIDDEKFAERFAREAQTLAQLNHPNIVTVHDYGETDGLYYIVMEFIDGVNLRDLLHDGKIDSAQALTIVPPICEALQYAHDKGIVHRDIKPENLLIDRDGRIKIADFGIASLVGANGEQSGTPPYMAPEQDAHTQVDHRADIYALGAVLYEMLTGERPKSPLDLPSSRMGGIKLDIRIDDIVLRALSKEPERRYRTANEFRTVVETISNDDTSKPPTLDPTPITPSPSTPIKKRSMFRRWWWILLSSILLGPVLGFFGGLLFGDLSPKKFEAKSIIQLGPKIPSEATSFNSTTEMFGELLSPTNLKQIADRHELPKRWQSSETEAIAQLKESIHLTLLTGTDLVQIRVQTTSAHLAKHIANSLPEIAAKNSPPWKITIHEMASTPTTPIVQLRKWLIIGIPLGLILGPILGIALMSLLQHIIPDRTPTIRAKEQSKEQKKKTAFYSKLALGLFLAGTLGTLAMMTLSHRHDIALIFGGVAIFLALLFGLLSRKRGVVIALIVIVILGAALTALSAVIFYYRLSSSKSIALENAELSALAAQLAAQEAAQGAALNTEKDFERVARLHMEAVMNMDLKAARTFWFPHTELSKMTDAQCLPNMRETNRAFENDPARMMTFSEWHRTGGYAIGRVTPPEDGDGQSIFLILGHSPKGWKIIEINDIRSEETLSEKLKEWLEAH